MGIEMVFSWLSIDVKPTCPGSSKDFILLFVDNPNWSSLIQEHSSIVAIRKRKDDDLWNCMLIYILV
jgi:hypothetical protein